MTVEITIGGGSDAPTTTPVAQTVAEDASGLDHCAPGVNGLCFTAEAFGFADVDAGADGNFTNVVIAELPDPGTEGTLQYNNLDITVGMGSVLELLDGAMEQQAPSAQRGINVSGSGLTLIPAGMLDDLVFTPVDRVADYTATFRYWVRDGRAVGGNPAGLYSRSATSETNHLIGSATMTISVTADDDAPTVANMIDDQTAFAGSEFSFTVPANTFADDGGVDNLTLDARLVVMTGPPATLQDLPTWLTFDAGTRTFSGTPPAGSSGSQTIRVIASDGTSSGNDDFTLTFGTGTNSRPVAEDDAKTGTEDDATITGNVLTDGEDDSIGEGDAGQTLRVVRYTAHDSDINMSPEDAPTSVSGDHGSLVITGTGANVGDYTYTLDAAAQALDAGDSVTDVFTYEISDGSATATATLAITITGVEDAPMLIEVTMPAPDKVVVEEGVESLHGERVVEAGPALMMADANAGGRFTYMDPDADDVGFGSGAVIQGRVGSTGVWVPGSAATRTVGSEMLAGAVLTGTYGRLYLNRDGSWQYRLDNDDPDTQALVGVVGMGANAIRGVETFTFRIDNGAGEDMTTRYSDEETVLIDVNGAGDAPTTSPRTRVVTVGDTLSFTADDFGFGDVDKERADTDTGDSSFGNVVIKRLPDASQGTLRYNNSDITVGMEEPFPTAEGVTVPESQRAVSVITTGGVTVIPAGTLNTNMLVFTPVSSSTSYDATFEYWVNNVSTSGRGANTGLYSRSATMTIRVTAAGSAPTVSIADAGVMPSSITEGQAGSIPLVRSGGDVSAALQAYVRVSYGSHAEILGASFNPGSPSTTVAFEIPVGTVADGGAATVQVLTTSEAAGQTPPPGTYVVSSGTALTRTIDFVSTVSIDDDGFPSAITENGSGAISFSRSGDISVALQAYFSVTSTSFTMNNVFGVRFAAGSDTATGTVNIPANTVSADETGATVQVLTPMEATTADNTLTPGTYVVGTGNAPPRTFTLANAPTVTVSGMPGNINEGMSGTIAFERDNTSGPLQAYFSVSFAGFTGGDALVFGVYFEDGRGATGDPVNATVNIPVNVIMMDATAMVTVLDPSMSLASSQYPAPGAYDPGTSTPTFMIIDNTVEVAVPTVSIADSGFPTSISEGSSGTIAFERDNTSGPLQAYFRVSSGSFTSDNVFGVDFADGSDTATVTVDIPPDVVGQDEVATVTVLTPSQATSRVPPPGAYMVGTASTFIIANVVVGANNPPVLAVGIPDRMVPAGVAYSYTIPANAFTDGDGDALSYEASGTPSWLGFNPGSRTFSGTPTSADITDDLMADNIMDRPPSTITVTASDGMGGSVSDSFRLAVSAVPDTVARAARNAANEEVLSELAQTLSLGAVNTVRQRSMLLSPGGAPQVQSSVSLDGSSVVDFVLSKAGTSPLQKEEDTGFFNESQALRTASFIVGTAADPNAGAAPSSGSGSGSLDLGLGLADLGNVNLATLGEGVVDSATGGTGSHGERVFRLWANAEHGDISSSPRTGLNFNSDTTTVSMGIERPVDDDKLFGLAVSWFKGEPEFRDSVLGSTGKSELEQWSLMPYAAYSFGPARVWGAFGFGVGDMDYSDTSMGGRSTSSDLSSITYAAGAEYDVATLGAFDLVGRVEAAGSKLRLDRAADGTYDAMDVNSTGLRGELELGVPIAAEYGQYRPYVTLGYRMDGGDGDTDNDAAEYGAGFAVNTIHVTAVASMRRQGVGVNRTSYALELAYDWYSDGKGLNLNVQNNIGSVNSGIWAKDYNYDSSASSASLKSLTNFRAGYGFESASWMLTPYLESDMHGGEVNRWVMGLSAGGSIGVLELTHTVRPAAAGSASDDQESWLQFGVDF